MQRSQSKILRAIANAPSYETNLTLHTDFNIPYVSDVIHKRINKHRNKLEAQPNPLLEPLLQPVNTRRLKRCWPLDLQGT
jgi:CRISPR/Cas system CMR subunit Cmr6 (Cas7 group RAMP superfamily)